MTKKVFILDTNVLLNNPNAIHSFENCEIIIPLLVLKELDKHKNRPDETGKNARTVNRILDGYRNGSSLLQGIKLPNNIKLCVKTGTPKGTELLPQELKSCNSVDTLLLALILELQAQNKRKEYILVTRDINLRIQCDALGIIAENYRITGSKVADTDLYGGVSRILVSQQQIDQFYKNGYLSSDICAEDLELYSNQFLVMKSDEQSASAIAKYDADKQILEKLPDIQNTFGIVARNKEQNFALNLLLDKDISLVTLTGPAGTGKTLLALATGCKQTVDSHQYEKLIIIKPIQPVGKDIGFLPGTLEEKLEPWISPIKDNLNYLFKTPGTKPSSRKNKSNNHYLSLLLEKNKIEIEAIAYIRGRSIPNAYIIIDEAQNLSLHELKTIITRVGEGTKIVLTGDLGQIDHPQLDLFTNGLTHAVEQFKYYNLAGHVTLIKGERSQLATLASKIL